MKQRISEKAKKAAWGINGSRYTISTKNGIDSRAVLDDVPMPRPYPFFIQEETDDPLPSDPCSTVMPNCSATTAHEVHTLISIPSV